MTPIEFLREFVPNAEWIYEMTEDDAVPLTKKQCEAVRVMFQLKEKQLNDILIGLQHDLQQCANALTSQNVMVQTWHTRCEELQRRMDERDAKYIEQLVSIRLARAELKQQNRALRETRKQLCREAMRNGMLTAGLAFGDRSLDAQFDIWWGRHGDGQKPRTVRDENQQAFPL